MYGEGAGSAEFTLGRKLPFWVDPSAGYNGGQFDTRSGFSNALLTVSTELELRDGWAFKPSLNYVFNFEDTVNDRDEWFLDLGFSTPLVGN